jgi:hypothetical protein
MDWVESGKFYFGKKKIQFKVVSKLNQALEIKNQSIEKGWLIK